MGQHQPGECAQSGKVRGRAVEELGDWSCTPTPRKAGGTDVLSGLDLHLACQNLIANQAFYALGMLAHNLLVSPAGPARRPADRLTSIIRHRLSVTPLDWSHRFWTGGCPSARRVRVEVVDSA